MADLLLKKGSYDSFKLNVFDPEKNIKNAVEGALYFTEDEGGLYLGKADKTVVRIQGTVHQYDTLKDFAEGTQPPYSKDIVYFIADKDALVRWNGTAWVQLNTPATTSAQMAADIDTNKEDIEGLEDSLSTLSETVATNKQAIESTVSGIDNRLTTAEGAIATLQGEIVLKATQADLEALQGIVGEQGDAIANITNNYVTNETFNNTVNDINADIKEINDALGLGDSTTGTIASRLDALESDNTTNKENIATNTENIQGLQDSLSDTNDALGALTERVTTAEGEIDTLQQDLDKAEEDLGKVTERVTTAEGEIDTLQGEMTQAKEDIEGLKDAVSDLETNSATKEELGNLNTTLTGEINSLKTKTDNTNTALGALTDRVSTAEGTIAGHTTQLKEITDTIAEDLATKDELKDLSDELKKEIDDDIIAANAMTYQGGVDGETDVLPTADVTIGDTYVVTKAFSLGDKTVQPGDLLIAQGTEVNGTIDPDTLVWDHVATGYSSIHNPKLTVGNNVITLTDFANNPISEVTLNSNSENIVITTDGDTNTINFDLKWGSF